MKSNISKRISITKVDPSQRVAYGWASVVERDGKSVVDLQDDQIELDELEKAVHSFMQRGGTLRAMHDGPEIGRVVESFLSTPETLEKIGFSPEAIESAPRGWWVAVKVTDDKIWQRVQDGELRAFSVGGKARREEL